MTLTVEYHTATALDCDGPARSPADDVLAAVVFGAQVPMPATPVAVRVELEPLKPASTVEVWRAPGHLHRGMHEGFRYAATADFLFAAIELDEGPMGTLESVTRHAYAGVRRLQQHTGFPHLLRVWNYMDDINGGEGDDERYRKFCTGRALGFGDAVKGVPFPAATAIGRPRTAHGGSIFQLLLVAARSPGTFLENPRQLSAFHYPRRYGPTAPMFSRAVYAPLTPLMTSGTASIVGHESIHGDVGNQCLESLRNVQALVARARDAGATIAADFGRRTLLKIYVRSAQAFDLVETICKAHLPKEVGYILLHADICRRDLLVEIDCAHA